MRVRLKADLSGRTTGRIVGVLVQWDDSGERYQIDRTLIEEIDDNDDIDELALMPEGAKPPQHARELRIIEILDNARDAFTILITDAIHAIEREIKK